jgi:general secretion pathway protein J
MTHGKAAGFTLLELLVALTVLSLVVLGAVQGLHFGIEGWAGEARRISATAQLDAVDRALRHLAHGIDIAEANAITGDAAQFSFVGRLPDGAMDQDQLAAMTLLVTRHHRLVLRWRRFRHANELSTPPIAQTQIADRIEAVRLSYALSTGGDLTAWRSAVARTVPALIRLQIKGEKGDLRRWPTIIIAPVVSPQ